jgi:hypothetical protein
VLPGTECREGTALIAERNGPNERTEVIDNVHYIGETRGCSDMRSRQVNEHLLQTTRSPSSFPKFRNRVTSLFSDDTVIALGRKSSVTTRYGLLHYANLIRRTGPYCFSFNLLNLATPLLSYAVRLVLPILVLLSSLPCYLYDAVLILTSDTLCSLIDTFLSILRYISTHVFVVEP